MYVAASKQHRYGGININNGNSEKRNSAVKSGSKHGVSEINNNVIISAAAAASYVA